ncbi:MAG: DNA topoisomerase IV subunit A [Pontimonas sp.]|nr:DNA topoisomerase IV subunit A [Pontimonas sp.]
MTAPTSPSPAVPSERIVDVELTDEMQGSFLEYAYSVIYSRALPDARDGLKPVQRRIIYQMAQMGLSPDKGHVKSARVVGEVMGKLHPHGDSAIYDALVRLAQNFSLRIPMVDGHGNFGSLDDGPAAARYTEARLRPEAMAMVADLDEDVVDFVPNYDNQLLQPSVLPAAIPHLLVNGASGIAVGMATNMAPHNLGEVVEALRHLIDNPDATLESLMGFLPGPDLPTGGTIVGLEGIKEAYETGRGSFKTQATVAVENVGPRKTGLVITELPYLVGPERVIDKIKDAVNSKKLSGISDVTDLTDRHNGLRLVISLKSGFDPQAVLAELYRLTPLEENFSINSVALVNGQPQTLGLKELLEVFLDHRVAVVTRRSIFRLDQRRKRLHLVEGLLIAMTDIDEVIQVIRSSDDVQTARTRLQEVFSLSVEQTDYILELRLRRLTRMSAIELETERDALREEIAHLTALLANPELIRTTVSDELGAVSEAYGTPRRSVLSGVTTPVVRAKPSVANLEISDAPCDVLVSATRRAARVVWPEGTARTPGTRGAHDALMAKTSTRLRGSLGAVTSAGNLHVFQPMDLPELDPSGPHLAEGVSLHEFLGLGPSDGAILAVVNLEDAPTVMLGTASGVVKRVALSGLPEKTQHSLISLKDGDTVVGASIAGDDTHCVFISSQGQLLHFPATAVRPQGPSAAGMAGIALGEGARVVWAGALPPQDASVITVSGSSQVLPGTEAVRIKRTALSQFPPKGRATGGVRAHTFLKGEDVLLTAYVGENPLALGPKGKPLELDIPEAKRDASGALTPESPEVFGEALS